MKKPPLHAPVTPTLIELNAEALAGNDDALRILIARSTTCTSLRELLERYVPDEDLLRVFDRYADEWARSRAKALLDTVELPAVEQASAASNLTNWETKP